MNGYLLTLVIVLIAFVVIALARLGHRNLPHPHRLSAGSGGPAADDGRAPGQDDDNSR